MAVICVGVGAGLRRPDAFTLVSFRGDTTGNVIKEDTGRAVTVVGNSTQTTGKFIGGAISCPAAGDYLSLLDSDDYAMGTSNITIETWAYITTMPAVSGHGYICGQYNSGTSLWYFRLRRNTSVDPVQCFLDIAIAPEGTAVFALSTTYAIMTTNVWYHLAVCRSGNSWYFFVNGTQVGTAVTQAAGISNVAAAFLFPRYAAAASSQLKANFDEFKITKNAKWVTNFTPPTRRY